MRKIRIGMRCYNPFVPNEIWDMFKLELRKFFKHIFPDEKFSIAEFYWQGFSYADEYIRITPKNPDFNDWLKVWQALDFVAHEFGMAIEFIYQENPCFKTLKNDTLFERKYSSYSLKNIRTWSIPELDEFMKVYSFEQILSKFYAEKIQN